MKHEPPTAGRGRLHAIATGPGAESVDPTQFRADLLRQVSFNVLVGNGDAHAKNYSLLLDGGLFAMAPAYDVAPVFYVNDRFSDFGMCVDGQRGLRHLDERHLVREAQSWGMPEEAARSTVQGVALETLDALDKVPVTELTAGVAQRVRSKAQSLAAGLSGS